MAYCLLLISLVNLERKDEFLVFRKPFKNAQTSLREALSQELLHSERERERET